MASTAVPMNNIRRLTGDHMVMSKAVSPHVLTAVEVGFLALVAAYVSFHLAATAIYLERRLRHRGSRPSAEDEALGLDEPEPEDEEILV